MQTFKIDNKRTLNALYFLRTVCAL